MAKKQTSVKETETTVEQEVLQQENKKLNAVDSWEIKDRVYYLSGDKTPLTFTLASRHTSNYPLLWFDEEKGYARELRYATNQKSPFLDEQVGHVTLAHIVFKDGTLTVSKEKQALQKLLSLYHPQKGATYLELDAQKDATEEVDFMELEIQALTTAASLDLTHAEAILRVESGANVDSMKSAEIKRDLYVFAKNDPELFLELVKDEDVKLRNYAAKAIAKGILKLSPDKKTVSLKSTGEKLLNVPFEETPLVAIASYFKSDKGLDLYSSIEKKIK